jgi:uncharacterized protein YndB with AHSA1/START domain
LAVAVLFVFVAFQTADYSIRREISIKAPPKKIFPYLVSAEKADSWMPWKDSDPNLKMSYMGPKEGIGSISSWESPGRMGVGQAEIVGVIPDQKIQTKITYKKPMVFEQLSEFTLTPNGETTTMTWAVTGKNNFIGRLMCTLSMMNMDKMVGGEFEKGLNKLKSEIEK